MIGARAEGDSLSENVGTGETAINSGGQYIGGLETSEHRTILFT